jgi:hypothetical protein
MHSPPVVYRCEPYHALQWTRRQSRRAAPYPAAAGTLRACSLQRTSNLLEHHAQGRKNHRRAECEPGVDGAEFHHFVTPLKGQHAIIDWRGVNRGENDGAPTPRKGLGPGLEPAVRLVISQVSIARLPQTEKYARTAARGIHETTYLDAREIATITYTAPSRRQDSEIPTVTAARARAQGQPDLATKLISDDAEIQAALNCPY